MSALSEGGDWPPRPAGAAWEEPSSTSSALDPEDSDPAGRRPMGVLCAALALATGLGIAEEEFSFLALALVVLGFGALGSVVLRGGLPPRRGGLGPVPAALRPGLVGVGVLVVVAATAFEPNWYAEGPWLVASHWLTRAAALVAALAVLPAYTTSTAVWRIAFGLAAGGGVAMLLAAPRPEIDVFYFLQQSTAELVNGFDLYRQTWEGSPGLYEVYPYLPGTSLLLAPARWLLGDVRFALLAASLLAAVMIRRLGGPGLPVLVPLLLVLAPRATWLWQQSWTEPLLLAALAGMVLAVRRGRPALAVVAFAVALASKQHVVLLVPLAMAWRDFGVRRSLASLGLAGVVVLPWFLAAPRAMIDDAVLYNLSLPVLARGLDLPALALRAGVELTFLPMAAGLIAAYVVALRRLTRDAAGFCLGSALVLWTLDLLNKQSFFNHYTLPLGLLLLAIGAAWGERPAAVPVPAQEAATTG